MYREGKGREIEDRKIQKERKLKRIVFLSCGLTLLNN